MTEKARPKYARDNQRKDSSYLTRDETNLELHGHRHHFGLEKAKEHGPHIEAQWGEYCAVWMLQSTCKLKNLVKVEGIVKSSKKS